MPLLYGVVLPNGFRTGKREATMKDGLPTLALSKTEETAQKAVTVTAKEKK
jgi:HSP20 family molecular chaperone IbpA